MRILKLLSTFMGRIGVVGLSVVLVFTLLIFYFNLSWHATSTPVLGIHYYYQGDTTTTIVSDLKRMKSDGFQIISIPLRWSDDPEHPYRVKTRVLMDKAEMLGLQVCIDNVGSDDVLQSYLAVYGGSVDYVEVINEMDAQFIKTWKVPGQLVTEARQHADTAHQVNSHIKTVASFATPLLPNLVQRIAGYVDIIALDIYEDIQLDVFTWQMQTLLTFSGKHNIWIGEFGHATLDDQTQKNFLIKGLNIFQKHGVDTVVIWTWNSDAGLKIKNRLSETAVKEWMS